MSQNPGIQRLLAAENEAAQIVQKAKQYRANKIKEARASASEEIAILKQQKQEEFKNRDIAVEVDTSSFDKEIAQMEKMFNENKDKVIEKILNVLVDCKPKIHDNVLFKMPKS